MGGTQHQASPGVRRLNFNSPAILKLPAFQARANARDCSESQLSTSIPSRILFVDDEERVLESIRRTIRTVEPTWSLHFAGSVDEARRLLADTCVDIVVTDVTMPRETGFDLLRHVRETPSLQRVPVIVLTGLADAELKRRALDL